MGVLVIGNTHKLVVVTHVRVTPGLVEEHTANRITQKQHAVYGININTLNSSRLVHGMPGSEAPLWRLPWRLSIWFSLSTLFTSDTLSNRPALFEDSNSTIAFRAASLLSRSSADKCELVRKIGFTSLCLAEACLRVGALSSSWHAW